ncbi:AtpZ/AtpI family protein [Baaleninema sp.]|uniref:AtpZ/AtpI family protein n=1 Tax=Baaleninema sp. TaxID=3101197 RepID=UPI003D0441D5
MQDRDKHHADRQRLHNKRHPAQLLREFQEEITKKTLRRQKAEREGDRSLWFSLGIYGLVGWSIAIPTLAGIAAGLWLDAQFPSRYSWTLMGLFLGLFLGCWSAWYWVDRASRE